jgi:hypothetical protein
VPHPYAANYCEENVWHLAGAADLEPGARKVVLIASLGPTVPLWCQRAADRPGDVVLWDYHVILAVMGPRALIYDLDTTLPFPCPLDDYVARTFAPGRRAPEAYRARFRVVDAETYRRAFWSDRSHMRREGCGWLSPPPAWAPILGAGLPLAAARDMRDGAVPGELSDLDGLMTALSR